MGPASWSSPHRKTYNNLVRAFALHGDSDGVVRTVQMMKENGMAIDDFIYNNLILVFGKNGYVWDRLESLSSAATEYTFSNSD